MQAKAALMELLVEFEQAKELEQQPQMVCPMEAKPSAENLQGVFLLEHWTSSLVVFRLVFGPVTKEEVQDFELEQPQFRLARPNH